MPYMQLQFRPGVNREVTANTNEGGWYDCDKIRFRMGFPETIGGWEKINSSPFVGTCRALHAWGTLSGDNYLAVGTSKKVYVLRGSALFDITPYRASESAEVYDVEFLTPIIEISGTTLTPRKVGDYVTISGATGLGGTITAEVLNNEFQIVEVIDSLKFAIDVGVNSTTSDLGDGGPSMVVSYSVDPGLDSSTQGAGWGAGAWGEGGWGEPADVTIPSTQLALWSFDNYGEDLLFCLRDGGVYYWDASTGLNTVAVELSTISGANSVPEVAKVVLVSDQDRHAIAFGCDDEFDPGNQDPLLIRFSAQENLLDWETRADNTAGSLRISSGSEIVTAVRTRQQILVLTDIGVHAMQYIGAPFTFGISELAVGTTIASPNALIAAGDIVYWMGDGDFYIYDGRVQQLPCSVQEYVFSNMNPDRLNKVYAGHNPQHSEVWWFYTSTASDENDSYVVYNYEQQIWYYGTMDRTAWSQRGVFSYNIAASPDGYLYYQEFGLNDGSQDPPAGINAYIESSPVDIAEGDSFMFASRVLPDITFRNSVGEPSVTMTFKAQDFPGGGYIAGEESGVVTRTTTVPVEQYTTHLDIRLRGRAVGIRVESDQYNTSWRLGIPRLDVRTDGRR